MKRILLLALTIGIATIGYGQSDTENRSERIDNQIESLKESLDTIDITSLLQQLTAPLGGDAQPSEKTLQELEQGMDQMLGILDQIDVSAMEEMMQAFIGQMGDMLGDFDLPEGTIPNLPNDNEAPDVDKDGQPIKKNKREMKKM